MLGQRPVYRVVVGSQASPDPSVDGVDHLVQGDGLVEKVAVHVEVQFPSGGEFTQRLDRVGIDDDPLQTGAGDLDVADVAVDEREGLGS